MTPFRCLLSLSILATPVLAGEPPAPDPYILFDGAVGSFTASNYTEAAEAFNRAAEAAPARGLSPAQALFDKGVALEAAADPAAAAAFLEAARSLNASLPLQARAYYNAGNLLLRQAMDARSNPESLSLPLAASDPDASEPPDPANLVAASIDALQNAIELAPDNIDAKASYELAALIQQQIQEEQQQQQQNQDQSNDDENQNQSEDSQQQSQEGDQNQEQQEQQQSQDAQDQQQQQDQQQSQSSQESQQSQDSQSQDPAEQMTPEEAAQLLDAMRAREQSQRDQLKPLFGRPVPVENDW